MSQTRPLKVSPNDRLFKVNSFGVKFLFCYKFRYSPHGNIKGQKLYSALRDVWNRSVVGKEKVAVLTNQWMQMNSETSSSSTPLRPNFDFLKF